MRNRVFHNVITGTALLFSVSIGNAQLAAPGAATVASTAPVAATAATAVPALVPYWGTALDSKARPLTGETSGTFLIYKNQQGGEPLFTESQIIAVDETGHYKVQLGASNPNGLPSDLFSSGEARWLEVQIAGVSPEPRILLASVPYALKAADSATLGGLPASAFALAGTATAYGTALAAPNNAIPDASSTVTTTGGTDGYLPIFTGKSTIADSVVFQNSLGIGIGDVPNAALDVNGKAIFRGAFQVARIGNATSKAGVDSNPFSFFAQAYNSSSKSNVGPSFSLQSEPTGNNTSSPGATLNVLYNNGTASSNSETGLYINSKGVVHFASGQTFPGTGSGDGTITGVTAGSGLTGGGTSGKVTLNVNTGEIPTLGGNNTFTGSDTFTASMNEDVDINIDNTNANTGNVSPGLRFGNASGEAISSQRNGSENQYGLDLYTGYQRRISISSTGQVAIGTTPDSGVQLLVINAGSADLFEAYADGSCVIDDTTDLTCGGTISGSAGNVKIDHPLDPANKYLVHASVESSEMMNIYSGNVTTDNLGIATVTLPDWFEAENGDFRYQLTTIGQDAHAWVSQKVANKQFKINTNASNVEVSWQITAVRQDNFAKAHPLVAEVAKPAKELGLYQHPELFGQPKEKGIAWAHNPKRIQQSKAQHAQLEPAGK